MDATAVNRDRARRGTLPVGITIILLVAALAIAIIANAIVAVAALAAGADPSLQGLNPTAYIPFTIIGALIAYAGWRVVRRITKRPDRALAVLVPIALVVSCIADVVVALGIVPGGTITGGIALGIMHLITVLVIVPVFNRIAPVTPAAPSGPTQSSGANPATTTPSE